MARPTADTLQNRKRHEALAARLLELFPGRFSMLDCGPKLGVTPWWASPPTPQEQALFDATVAGWDWSEQPDEAFETRAGMPRILAALLIRASSQWAALSPAKKARIAAIIDVAAQRAIDSLEAGPNPNPNPGPNP